MIRDHVAASLCMSGRLWLAPFNQEGGLGKVHQIFGADLSKIIEELNGTCLA
jgi:type I restriction enzyme R subunit